MRSGIDQAGLEGLEERYWRFARGEGEGEQFVMRWIGIDRLDLICVDR